MKDEYYWLQKAHDLAKRCTPIETAFCVGAILVDENDSIIAESYSRDIAPRIHAEESAIKKAVTKHANLDNARLFCSLEPCGERLSGKKTCVQRIIDAGIRKVYFSEYEPSTFVEGTGYEQLKAAGITVTYLSYKDSA